MKAMHGFVSGMYLLICSFAVSAAEAQLSLVQPEKFTDIRPSNQTRSAMQASVQQALQQELSDLAKKLPEKMHLVVQITDIDLAGEVNPVGSMNTQEIRIIKDLYYPRIRFNYQLHDAAGAVHLEGRDVRIQDMGFMMSGRLDTRRNFYYERALFRDWFNKQLLPALGK